MKKRLGQQPIAADVAWLRVLLGKCGLAQPGGWFPFTQYQPDRNYACTSAGYPFAGTVSRSMVVKSWVQSWQVLTTNDASNYWRITLAKLEISGATNIQILDTSAGGTAGWYQSSDLNLDVAVSHPSVRLLRINVSTIGSPGALYLACPAVFVI